MTTVCLITLLGWACAFGADTLGDCQNMPTLDGGNVVYCYADAESIPLAAWTYDPAQGGINCDHDCTVTANGTPVTADLYGTSAACPHDWLNMTLTTPYGTWRCNDRGGAVRLTWREVWVIGSGYVAGWYWMIDFMLADPAPWNYAAIPAGQWSVK